MQEPRDGISRRAIVEALLFVAAEPMPPQRFLQVVEGLTRRELAEIIEELNRHYEEEEHALVVEEVAGGYQMLTRASFHPWIASLLQRPGEEKLSGAALEALAVIAYKQPVTKAEVESIRGVQSGHILRSLLERKLIRIAGRADVLGRPLLYETTRRFLEHFGLRSLKDLPKAEELRALRSEESEAVAREGSELLYGGGAEPVATEGLGREDDDSEGEPGREGASEREERADQGQPETWIEMESEDGGSGDRGR